jgi:predicted PurR-regulated permease PerM
MVRRASEPVRAVLLAAALIVAYLTFSSLVTLLVTLVIIGIVAMPLAVAADWFEHRGMPAALGRCSRSWPASGCSGGARVVIPSFVTQAERFIDEIPQTFAALRSRISDATGRTRARSAGASRSSCRATPTSRSGSSARPPRSGLGVVGVLATTAVVLITAFYVAMKPGPLLAGFYSLFPARRRGEVEKVLGRAARGVGRLAARRGDRHARLGRPALHRPDDHRAGLRSCLRRPQRAARRHPLLRLGARRHPAILIALADSPGKALLTLVVYLVVQQIEGNVILPVVMSRYVSLHPAMIVIGVVVVGQVVGFLGLFVAVRSSRRSSSSIRRCGSTRCAARTSAARPPRTPAGPVRTASTLLRPAAVTTPVPVSSR